MTITITYFGILAEVTHCHDEQLEFSGSGVTDLLEALYIKYPELRDKTFQVAQGNVIATGIDHIKNNNIALLPPFAGG